MRALITLGLTAAVLWYWFGWFSPEQRYAAEVGYYNGSEVAWDLWGDYKSLGACQNAAIARYNYYASENGRGHSWSCLLKNGKGGYTSRHR